MTMNWPEFFAALGTFIVAVGLPTYLAISRDLRRARELRERREEAREKRAAALMTAIRENTQATDAARRATTDHARVLAGSIPARALPGREVQE